ADPRVVRATLGGFVTSFRSVTPDSVVQKQYIDRTYHIQLKSHTSQYMARVGFDYPEDVSIKLADVNARLESGRTPGAGVPSEQLTFAYTVS
ncbi:hypothetical protein ACEQ6C_39165, partial [Rhizobium ruizarguesonis]